MRLVETYLRGPRARVRLQSRSPIIEVEYGPNCVYDPDGRLWDHLKLHQACTSCGDICEWLWLITYGVNPAVCSVVKLCGPCMENRMIMHRLAS